MSGLLKRFLGEWFLYGGVATIQIKVLGVLKWYQ